MVRMAYVRVVDARVAIRVGTRECDSALRNAVAISSNVDLDAHRIELRASHRHG